MKAGSASNPRPMAGSKAADKRNGDQRDHPSNGPRRAHRPRSATINQPSLRSQLGLPSLLSQFSQPSLRRNRPSSLTRSLTRSLTSPPPNPKRASSSASQQVPRRALTASRRAPGVRGKNRRSNQAGPSRSSPEVQSKRARTVKVRARVSLPRSPQVYARSDEPAYAASRFTAEVLPR